MYRFHVRTNDRLEMLEITEQLQELINRSEVQEGTLFLVCPHTSCGITIQENADPGVQHDMLMLLDRLAPRRDPRYEHIEDNSAAHLQTAMMGVSEILFIENGRLVLGRWQGVYLCEFDGPRERTLQVKIVADR